MRRFLLHLSSKYDWQDMEVVNDLLKNFRWPGITSITFGNGNMIVFEKDFPKGSQPTSQIEFETTLDVFLKENPEEVTVFDIFARTNRSKYDVCVGDCSYEDEGIIYVKNIETDSLHWFAFFEIGGPFKKVWITDADVINAANGDDLIWRIDIDNPFNVNISAAG